MKKILRKVTYIGLLSFALFNVSCNDAIDIIQKDEANEELVYQNVDDLQKGLNGVYLSYNPGANSNGNGDAILFNDLFTDNLRTGTSYGGHGLQTYSFNLQTNSYTPESIWLNRLQTINYANRVLKAYDRIFPTLTAAADIAKAENIKAQILTMRAIAHFDIFLYFTPNYNDQNGVGGLVIDYVPGIYDQPQRKTVLESINFIKADLTEAKELVSNPTTTPFYINEDVIDAYFAKVALVSGDYPTAGALAEALLAKYPIVDKTAYWSMFSDTGNGDAIFSLMRVRGNSAVAGSWYSNNTSAAGSPLFNMSKQLYELYDAGDVRNSVGFVLDETSDLPNHRYLINKYPGGEQPLLNHIKLVRGSEMLFIAAEVKARGGDYAGAANMLRELNNARVGSLTPAISFNNLNDALARILTERRKEFAFEGQRYLDIKRIGREINYSIERDVNDADSFAVGAPTSLPASDYRFTLPIPRVELDANPTIQQNPNYN